MIRGYNYSMLLNIFFLLLGICTVRADSDVIPLDNTNFDQIVTADSGDWLIVFYAPWCQYCQSFMPTYETIAHDLLSNNPKISTAKVDVMGTGNRNLGTRFDIEAFPTFKLIHDGYTFTYQGPRTYDDIKNFATGGYKLYESTPTPGPAGLFGDIMRVYKVAWDNAIEDINAGHVFTLNVFVTVMPYLFVFIIILGCLLPAPKWEPPPRRGRDGRVLRVEEPDEAEDEDESDDVALVRDGTSVEVR